MNAVVHAQAEGRARADLGMWVFIASEMVFFGPLLLAYGYGRSQWPEGFALAGRHTDALLGTVNTALLLTSSLCAALAAAAHEAGDRRWAARLLAATAALGVVFLAIKGLEYRSDWHQGLFPGPAFRLAPALPGAAPPKGAQLFFALYFFATGLHAMHVTIGVALMAALALGQHRASRWASGNTVMAAGLYWHFVDVMWVLLYPLLYLVNRHS